MRVVSIYLEGFILVLGAWTVAMVIAIYAGLGYNELHWMFPLLALAALISAAPGWRRVLASADRAELRQAGAALAVGLALATAVLVLSRPDLDDLGYMSQRLQDALSPDQSLTWKGWRLPFVDGTVWINELSVGEVYDPLAIVLADLLGGHPMSWYHNILPVFITLAWVAVYLLLLDKFGVRGWRRWLALAGVVVLLCLDGAHHRSFGNFWLLRIWQGKIMMMSVLIPMLMLYAWRVLETARRRDLLLVLLLVAIGPFINRSALFLFPAVLLTFGLAYWLSFRASSVHVSGSTTPLYRIAMVMLPLLVLIIIVVVATYVSLPEKAFVGLSLNADVAAGAALEELSRAFLRTPWAITRDIVLLLLVPLLALSGQVRFIIPIMSALAALFLFTPPWSDSLYQTLSPTAYWRLYYVLPLPLTFALVPLVFTHWSPSWPRGAAKLLAGIALLATLGFAFEKAILTERNHVSLKWPWELRMKDSVREPLARFYPHVVGKTVLAPNHPSYVLQTLYYRDVRVAFTRAYPRSTGIVVDAQVQLAGCKVSEAGVKAIEHYLSQGADAMITRRCGREVEERLFSALAGLEFNLVETVGNYKLYLLEESQYLLKLRAEWQAQMRFIEAKQEHWRRGELSKAEFKTLKMLYKETGKNAD